MTSTRHCRVAVSPRIAFLAQKHYQQINVRKSKTTGCRVMSTRQFSLEARMMLNHAMTRHSGNHNEQTVHKAVHKIHYHGASGKRTQRSMSIPQHANLQPREE
jgi:hypothetical protein